ncbi:MAG: hypothetical protein JKY19_11720 [Alcanivoracaceae bacterium]|nr:hypothetical protein [Alcanivoracaceae bacterium]
MNGLNQQFNGLWTYRSYKNDTATLNPDTPLGDLLFGMGDIEIVDSAVNELHGRIFGSGWELNLNGYKTFGNPNEVRFQGRGIVGGHQWVYDYVAYLINDWPDGVDQVPALVGSIVRTIPHPNSSGGINPAGEVASWIAVKQKC